MNHGQPYRPQSSQIPTEAICASTRITRRHPVCGALTIPPLTANYLLFTANSTAATPAPPAHPIQHSTFFILHWPYTFSAKEKDSETGLSYFGSRYYSSDLSIWLSVDPMSDKYPSLSPYSYCANNPVRVVDPNGEEIGEVDEASRKKINALTDKNSSDYSRAFTRKYNQLAKSKTVYNFREASQDEITTERRGGVFQNNDGSVDIIHSEGGTRTSREGGFSFKYSTLFEETFHASEFDKGRLNINAPTCFDEAKAWKFAIKAPGTSFWDKAADAYTFAGAIRKMSVEQLTNFFHEGGVSTVDEEGRGEHLMGAEKGLYHNLKLK